MNASGGPIDAIRGLLSKVPHFVDEENCPRCALERYLDKLAWNGQPLPCGHDNRNLIWEQAERDGWYRCRRCKEGQ
jgi:hypothetical protein